MKSEPIASGDAKKNASYIFNIFQRRWLEYGFTEHRSMTVCRSTNVKMDIVRFHVLPKSACQKWRTPLGSFITEVGCLFPFLPRVGNLRDENVLRPDNGFGQLRLTVYKGITQVSTKARNIWWSGTDAAYVDEVASDVIVQLESKALPFFEKFESPQQLLTFLLHAEDRTGEEGIWDFGKQGAPLRLLYTGFAAIECGEWGAAEEKLAACRKLVMAAPTPIAAEFQGEFMPYIHEGLACIQNKRPWTLIAG